MNNDTINLCNNLDNFNENIFKLIDKMINKSKIININFSIEIFNMLFLNTKNNKNLINNIYNDIIKC